MIVETYKFHSLTRAEFDANLRSHFDAIIDSNELFSWEWLTADNELPSILQIIGGNGSVGQYIDTVFVAGFDAFPPDKDFMISIGIHEKALDDYDDNLILIDPPADPENSFLRDYVMAFEEIVL